MLLDYFCHPENEMYVPAYANSWYLHFEKLLYSLICESAKFVRG